MYQPLMRAAELAIVARAIHSLDADDLACDPEVTHEVREAIARHFAAMLATTNSQFDPERFVRAAVTGINRRSSDA